MKIFRKALVSAVLVSAVACSATTDDTKTAASDAKAGGKAISKPDAGPAATLSCPVRGPFDPSSGYFSQFYEDYILSYVLRDVTNGAYVDVGANDPNVASLTKYFYLKGWRGVDIEPNPDMVALLRQYRPEDSIVPEGISDKPGKLSFYNFKTATGLSTFDKSIADDHLKEGIKYDVMNIPVDTLNDVLGQNDKVKNGITFLNADVEGFEREVFRGIDFKKYPVWIVMAEATAPETENPTYHSWENILSDSGYVFGMDDGLNRYYVHPAHKDLLQKFVEVNYCVEKDKLDKGVKLNGYMKEKG